MLGKGLESLIPQKGGSGDDAAANGQGSDPGGAPASQPSWKPQSLSQSQKDFPLNDPPPLDFPILPEELDLPSGDDIDVDDVEENEVVSSRFPVKPAGFTRERSEIAPQKIQSVIREEAPVSSSVFQIEVDKIVPNPSQPRRTFDEEALKDMAHSIREFGILQPLTVTKIKKETPNGMEVEYQLIAGERRLMASKLAGLKTVPVIIRHVDLEREKLELAIIENLQRENLNPIESARAFERLRDEFKLTQREIAVKLGKSREVIANAVRLLDLPPYVQEALQKGQLQESSARFLLAIEDANAQRRLFDDIVQNKLTTRDVREKVRVYTKRPGRPPGSGTAPISAELRAAQEELAAELGAPVEIQKGAHTSNGRITITFYSQEELENILKKLNKDRE